ncbi:MAG: DUF192 domain-containing protein [bacterium]|nr:DUF192 domain-containing protein [bacterium]
MMIASVFIGAFLVLLFLVLLTRREVASPLVAGSRKTQIRVGDKSLSVEVAETSESRARGLMNRASLPWDEGMLFVFDQEQALAFWMKNTLIPLDIAFADAAGVIFQIAQMEPQTLTPHPSSRLAKYALEVNRGWFAKNGLKAGAKIAF